MNHWMVMQSSTTAVARVRSQVIGQATLPFRDDDHQHPTKLGSIVRLYKNLTRHPNELFQHHQKLEIINN